MIDTHCHLDDPRFDPDREDVWLRAKRAGISLAVVPAVHPRDWPRVVACAREHPEERVFALGIHPAALPELSLDEERLALAELATQLRTHGAVAVGECGLDGVVAARGDSRCEATMDRQQRVLRAQLEVARALALPVVLHAFRAHEQLLVTLRSMGNFPAGGVVHSYSGGPELVAAYTKLGLSLSFGGSITRPSARKPVEALRRVPSHALLLETDAPDQPPSGLEIPTQRCEPAHLRHTLRYAANLLKCSEEALEEQTEDNARKLFLR